jgi:pSer/pThr/pTyr-binding forkhead associated (FHA) protein
MYRLEIRDDEGRSTVVPLERLTREEVTIGRKEGNSIRLTERNVSRQHAKLVRRDAEVFIEDSSRYGTRINGRRIAEPTPLGNGDILLIGDYQLAFEIDQDASLVATADAQASGRDSGDSTAMVNLDKFAEAERDTAHPRLVATSTGLAGTTYELTSDEVVLGRTDDNDIVIDHRSVSKHHATLTREGDQWSVKDQESANGLKINGEDYTHTTLRKGDVLELGHVKLRFVAAGEDYTYIPSADDPTGSPAGTSTGGKGLAMFLVIGGIATALGLAWFMIYSQDSPNPGVSKATSTDTGAGSVEALKTSPKAADPGTKASRAPAGVDVSPLLKRAGELMDARKWAAATAVYREAASKAPTNAEATLGLSTAESEKSAQDLYDGVSATFKAGQVEEAWTKAGDFGNIADHSTYFAQAAELQKAISLDYSGRLIDQAKVALRNKRYPQASRLAGKALKITPDHAAAKALVDKARKKAREEDAEPGVVAKPPEAAKAKAPEPVKAKKPEPVKAKKPEAVKAKKPEAVKEVAPAAAAGHLSAGELYKAARGAHRKGDAAAAVSLYKKAAQKGSAKAWRQLGTLYGGQGKTGAAIKAWKKYLKLRPGASDAETIRNAIIRYGGTP